MPSRSRMWQAVTRVRFAAPSSGASKAGAPARLEDAITQEPPLPNFRLQLFNKGKVKILDAVGDQRLHVHLLVARGDDLHVQAVLLKDSLFHPQENRDRAGDGSRGRDPNQRLRRGGNYVHRERQDDDGDYFYPLIHNPILSAATKTSLPPPELLGGEARAFSHRLELGPSDLGMADPRAQAAVRTRHDIFATHQLGVLYQALCDRLRVFNEVAIVAGNSRNEHLPLRQLDLFPHPPLMLMAGI